MNYATLSLKNHLTSSCLKMLMGEADTVRLVSKSAPQMIRHFSYSLSSIRFLNSFSSFRGKLNKKLYNLELYIKFRNSETQIL